MPRHLSLAAQSRRPVSVDAQPAKKPATSLLDRLDALYTQSLMRWNERRGEIIEMSNSLEIPDGSKANRNSCLKGG